MSKAGALGPKALSVLRAVQQLGKADCRDVGPLTGIHVYRCSGILHDLEKTGYLRRTAKRACMDVRMGGGRGSDRVVYEATGQEPAKLLPPARCGYQRPIRSVGKPGKGSGVIAPPPYRYGFMWLNARGAPR
jgi:hypothetical protein